jgi:chromosome segregation ATPase
MAENSVIETGVDKLVAIIRSKGRISVPEAAKELGVGPIVVEEWADFLEEEGIISIEYKFATPYLIERKLTKTEINEKEKEFHSKKEGFVRKAEGTLAVLDKEGGDFKSFKDNFDRIKKDIGSELEKVESEFKQLEKYESLKNNIDKQVMEQEKSFREKLDSFDREIQREQEKYNEILNSINIEEEKLDKERLEDVSLREKEIAIKKKLDLFSEDIQKINKAIRDEEIFIDDSEKRIKDLKKRSDSIKKEIILKKSRGEELVKESSSYGVKILGLQKEILDKVSMNKGAINRQIEESKASTNKFKEFFKKKYEIENLIKDLDKEKDEMEYALIDLIKKAKAYHLSSNSTELKNHTKELEKKFDEIKKKKVKFEQETRQLSSFMNE